MEKLLKSNNSIFKRNVVEVVGDLSEIGTVLKSNNYETITVPRKWHSEYFLFAVVYYNIENHDFELAIARNTRECEAIGIISDLNENTATITVNGYMPYFASPEELEYDFDTPMYLSDTEYGKLTIEPPERVIKQVAKFHKDAIMIDIERGEFIEEEPSEMTEFESYTQEELDDIISCTWWEERHA